MKPYADRLETYANHVSWRGIKGVPVKTVLLENARHYPIAQPGLDQMVTAINEFCSDMTRLTRLERCATTARRER